MTSTAWPAAWGLEPRTLERAGTGKHIFTHIEWHMTALAAGLPEDAALPEGWVWANLDELRQTYAVPNAFDDFRPLVERRLRGQE